MRTKRRITSDDFLRGDDQLATPSLKLVGKPEALSSTQSLLDLFPPIDFDLGFNALGVKWDSVTNRWLCVPCWNMQHYLPSLNKKRANKISNCLRGGCECSCVEMLDEHKKKKQAD